MVDARHRRGPLRQHPDLSADGTIRLSLWRDLANSEKPVEPGGHQLYPGLHAAGPVR